MGIANLIMLFLSAYIAATLSGAAGFGGALLLLPALTALIGVDAAIPVLTIGQIFGNASRVWFGRRELSWKPIMFFLITAIPLTILGSYLFVNISSQVIKIGIGVFLILLVIYRRMPVAQTKWSNKGMLLGGSLTGLLSGLVGSAGPLGAAFFLGLNLAPTAYIASEAFTALIMHLIKTVVYGKYALIASTELAYGLFIGIAMILGSWTGKRIIEILPKKYFRLLIEILLLLSGVQLIVVR